MDVLELRLGGAVAVAAEEGVYVGETKEQLAEARAPEVRLGEIPRAAVGRRQRRRRSSVGSGKFWLSVNMAAEAAAGREEEQSRGKTGFAGECRATPAAGERRRLDWILLDRPERYRAFAST